MIKSVARRISAPTFVANSFAVADISSIFCRLNCDNLSASIGCWGVTSSDRDMNRVIALALTPRDLMSAGHTGFEVRHRLTAELW